MKYNIKETQICVECGVEKKIKQFSLNGRNGYRNIRCKPCVVILKNGYEKICLACNIKKPIDEFPSKTGNGTVRPRCKECVENKIYIPKEKKDLSGRSSSYPLERLSSNLTKEDYKDTYLFLQDVLGYDLKSKLSIHEQFCKKHNLTPNNPLNEFKGHFSIKECFS